MKRIRKGPESLLDTWVGVGKRAFVAGEAGDESGVAADAQALNRNASKAPR